jgi:ribosomal protein L15
MKDFGLLKKLDLPVKILGAGEVSGPVTVQANAFSRKAKEKIEELGGKAEIIWCWKLLAMSLRYRNCVKGFCLP